MTTTVPETAAPTFTVGDEAIVRTSNPNPPYSSGLDAGTRVRVTSDPDNDGDHRVRRADGTGAQTWYVRPEHLTPIVDVPSVSEGQDVMTPPPPVESVETLRAELETLRAASTRLEQERDFDRSQSTHWQDRYRAAVAAHRTDVQTIGAALLAEAEERGWCETFDRVVSDLNENLAVELPVRSRTFTVSIVDADGTEYGTVDVQVDGNEDPSDAAAKVWQSVRCEDFVTDYNYS